MKGLPIPRALPGILALRTTVRELVTTGGVLVVTRSDEVEARTLIQADGDMLCQLPPAFFRDASLQKRHLEDIRRQFEVFLVFFRANLAGILLLAVVLYSIGDPRDDAGLRDSLLRSQGALLLIASGWLEAGRPGWLRHALGVMGLSMVSVPLLEADGTGVLLGEIGLIALCLVLRQVGPRIARWLLAPVMRVALRYWLLPLVSRLQH